MKLETLNIADIREYDRNARTHSPAQVRQIAASIREFGFNDPVAVDEDNVLIEGHGRLAAARLLNMIEVPALRLGHLSHALSGNFASICATMIVSVMIPWRLSQFGLF